MKGPKSHEKATNETPAKAINNHKTKKKRESHPKRLKKNGLLGLKNPFGPGFDPLGRAKTFSPQEALQQLPLSEPERQLTVGWR